MSNEISWSNILKWLDKAREHVASYTHTHTHKQAQRQKAGQHTHSHTLFSSITRLNGPS